MLIIIQEKGKQGATLGRAIEKIGKVHFSCEGSNYAFIRNNIYFYFSHSILSVSLFLLQTSVCTLPQDLGEELFLHLAWGSTELLHNQINIAMIHPLATTASCKFHWWCLAAYEIKKKKKDREWEWEEKKPLVKNLSTIDFLPCWSSTYHPASHRPAFPPSLLCCVLRVPCVIFQSGK